MKMYWNYRKEAEAWKKDCAILKEKVRDSDKNKEFDEEFRYEAMGEDFFSKFRSCPIF